MNNKGKPSVPPSSASACQGPDAGVESSQLLLSRLTPIFSREMSLQAHFSFGAQTAGGPHTCVPQLMATAREDGAPSSSDPASKHFTWTANDGSQCSLACGQQGLSVSYNNTQHAPLMVQQHVCGSRHTPHQAQGRDLEGLHLPLPQTKVENVATNWVNRGDLPARSLTFSGTQNVTRAPQKQYGRRCKSTAHIVLKQNENKPSAIQPHEFHSLPTRDYTKPRDKSREANDKKDAKVDERPSRPRMTSNLNKIHENLPCDFCQTSLPPPLMNCCPCHQCSVHRMVTSLPCSCSSCLHNYHHHNRHYRHPDQPQHQSCYHHHHRHGQPPLRCHHDDHDPADTGRCSATSATFNSHKCYEEQGGKGRASGAGNSSPCRAGFPKRKSPLPRSLSDQKHRPPPEHHLPQDRKDSGPRLPRVGVAYPSHQEDRGGDGADSRRSRGKVRPRTIHIDVYCSTSSDDDTIEGHYSSDDSPNPTVPRTLVALGSKNSKKNQVDLKKRDVKGDSFPAREDASSFIFQRGQARSPRTSAFITDVPLTLSGSPSRALSRTSTPASQPETSTASDATKILSPRGENIPQLLSNSEPQAVRPTTLPIPSLASPSSRDELLKRRRNSSLSYVSSPFDFSTWDADQDIPSSGLSWRGSEFDAPASLLSDNEADDSQRRSSLALARSDVFYEGDSEGTEVESNADNASSSKFWRSPHLERRKYIQKGQEDRYKESVKRRTLSSNATEVAPPVIPSDVAALAKLSVFKNFSTEELEVISKSLNKRESINSADRKSSFRAIEREESIKLLKRMASISEPGGSSTLPKSDVRDLDDRAETNASDQRHTRVHRSSSLNSRTSSSSSRASQAMIRTLDTIDDKLESNGNKSSAALASPLSKSLQGIPGEVDEVSALERHCTSLPSNNSAPRGTPVLVGERFINVGVFRNLQRFPFASQTVPTPSHHRMLNRRQCSPSERLFVRPQMFGEVLRSQRRRPIHFGPPRNPQCCCESCCGALALGMMVSSQGGARTGLDPVSIRAWSLSDLGPATSPTLMPPHTSSPSLSLNTASDISALPQLGSAAAGGEQHKA